MIDDDPTLASAFLDGEATPDERARVEADPMLLAEVDRLRSVRTLLADVEPALISSRERHLAAALDAWDRLPEPERLGDAYEPGAPPTSLADRRRARTNRWMLGAAAAIVVVLAGGLVLQTVSSDDENDAVTLEATADERSASEPAAGAATDATAPAAAAQNEASQEFATPDGDATDSGVLDAAPPADSTLEQLQTPDELAIFASDALAAPTAPRGPDVTSAPVGGAEGETDAALTDDLRICLGVDDIVGPAIYDGVVVVVGIDRSRSLAFAYDPENCREIARARLP